MDYILETKRVVSSDIIERFKDVSAATAHEAMGRRGAVDYRIKPLDDNMRICGIALTVECKTGDNLLLAKAISMAQRGDVIVLNAGNAEDSGSFGEVLATECVARGLGGFVTNCSVRDSSRLRAMGFPVFSRGVSIYGTSKASLGSINKPISFGGVCVNSGDLVIGDADGIVIIPADEAEDVLKASLARDEAESIIMERLRNGESFYDIKNYSETIRKLV